MFAGGLLPDAAQVLGRSAAGLPGTTPIWTDQRHLAAYDEAWNTAGASLFLHPPAQSKNCVRQAVKSFDDEMLELKSASHVAAVYRGVGLASRSLAEAVAKVHAPILTSLPLNVHGSLATRILAEAVAKVSASALTSLPSFCAWKSRLLHPCYSSCVCECFVFPDTPLLRTCNRAGGQTCPTASPLICACLHTKSHICSHTFFHSH